MSLTNKVNLLSKLEDIMFHINESNVEEALSLFSEFRPQLLASFINDISYQLPFSYKHLGYLYSHLPKDTNKYYIITYFTLYITLKGLLTNQNFYGKRPESNRDPSFYENGGLAENSPEYYIYHNDLPNFTLNYGQTDLSNHQIRWVGHRIKSIVSFCAFVGNLDILKYLLVNNYPIEVTSSNDDTAANALRGGSEIIIEFLVSKDCSFDNRLASAAIYHQNKLAYWLLENYHCEYILLPYFVTAWNTELFLHFLEERKDIYEMTELEINSLAASQTTNNDILEQFIKDYIKNNDNAKPSS